MNKEQKVQNQHISQHSSNEMLPAALSGNILIAKFMGYKELSEKESWGMQTPHLLLKDINGIYVSHTQIKYHSSWDWLMPVVEKIEGFGFTFIIDGLSAYCYERGKIMYGKSGIAETKIEAVWTLVIKFIKWQNDNAVSVGSR